MSSLLSDPLFLATVRTCVISQPDHEKLLTTARRQLLLDPDHNKRLAESPILDFAIALMEQCWLNEYVWQVTPEEERALEDLNFDRDAALRGDPENGRRLLLASLYAPITTLLDPVPSVGDALAIEPKPLREVVLQRLAAAEKERRLAAGIPGALQVTDETSLRVAEQYEANPYPRWTSIGLLRKGQFLRSLEGFFQPRELAFLQRPFKVLIAGCGTGRQIVSASNDYGQNARIVGLDLSRTSLGYAARMAEELGATNVEFLQGDLQAVGNNAAFARRFHVVECTGVLHHMADPMAGWAALTNCIADGGIMLVALYSATARQAISALRNDPAYPGADCDDRALRAYRHSLLEQGSELTASLDFYTASEFRDLVLHVQEHTLTLDDIKRLLDANGLAFRGFLNTEFAHLQSLYPQEPWPGLLEHWAECEHANPRLFVGMYQFWCTRK